MIDVTRPEVTTYLESLAAANSIEGLNILSIMEEGDDMQLATTEKNPVMLIPMLGLALNNTLDSVDDIGLTIETLATLIASSEIELNDNNLKALQNTVNRINVEAAKMEGNITKH